MDYTHDTRSVNPAARYPDVDDLRLARVDQRWAWIDDGTGIRDVFAWMARDRGPTPAEWGALCRLASRERAERRGRAA